MADLTNKLIVYAIQWLCGHRNDMPRGRQNFGLESVLDSEIVILFTRLTNAIKDDDIQSG